VKGRRPFKERRRLSSPLLRGRGLFINLTPFIPLSFEGEGEGRKPLTTPGKRLIFDSVASRLRK